MDKADVRILIVEDDASFGASLAELFKRSGFECLICPGPDQAIQLTEHQEFQALIIDCMLPKMNGVELAKKLLADSDPKPPIFLMSGVYKDKNFMREALDKTGAVHFFYKPFEPQDLLTMVEAELRKQFLGPDLEPISTLLTMAECPSVEILDVIQKQRSIPAYQFPLILALFTRQGMTGELHLVISESEAVQITYLEGKIVDVRSQSANSQMGSLLVEFGFAISEDVEAALAVTSPSLPLGTRLIQAGALSPHAVSLIREEQVAIRLSQLIQNTSIELSWHKQDIEMKDTFHALPPSRLKQLMSEWVLSKIPEDWLRSFYFQFSERQILWRGKAPMKMEGAKANMPLLPAIIERITSQPVLQDLISDSGEAEVQCLQAIHTLVLERKIYFGPKRKSLEDYAGKINRFQRLLKTWRSKDYFEILGVSRKTWDKEIHRAYTELAKRFHPDTVPPDAPEEFKKVCNAVFTFVNEAYKNLRDEKSRTFYLDELGRQEANRIFELEPIYEAAILDLRAQKYAKAIKKFEELIAAKATMPDLLAYSYWAKIKVGPGRVSEREFFEIPPENRHSPIYLLAKGLFFKSSGQFQKALECFQNARFLDPRLSEAQKEIVELLDEAGTKVSGMNTIINKLLGKKKSA